MKCPNCSSQMLVTDETVNSKSQVVFFRCSLCVSEHVSSTPIMESEQEPVRLEASGFFDSVNGRTQYAL